MSLKTISITKSVPADLRPEDAPIKNYYSVIAVRKSDQIVATIFNVLFYSYTDEQAVVDTIFDTCYQLLVAPTEDGAEARLAAVQTAKSEYELVRFRLADHDAIKLM